MLISPLKCEFEALIPLMCYMDPQRFIPQEVMIDSGLKSPWSVHSNIHPKNIHLKIPEWTSMVHGYSIDTWISHYMFTRN